jgi:hypothetical protein
MIDLLRFAVTIGVLYGLHMFADHWVQTHHQATTKGARTAAGLAANLRHVATLSATLAAGLLLLNLRYPALDYNPAWLTLGIAVNGISHAWADHRPNLQALAYALKKRDYYDAPGGSYQLDQAWHHGWLIISALFIAI